MSNNPLGKIAGLNALQQPWTDQMRAESYRDLLVDKAIRNLYLGKGAAKKVLNEVFGSLADLLAYESNKPGTEIRIHELGTFKIQAVAAREFVNPMTGALSTIPAHNKVTLKFTKALRNLCKES